MAAITAKENAKDSSVTIIEKMPRPLRKVMITGKGRCNVTNNASGDVLIKNVPKNPRFLYSAFSAFSAADTMSFFENLKVPLKTERGNRVFPQSDKAVSIVDALIYKAKSLGVKTLTGEAEEILIKDGRVSGVSLKDKTVIPASAVILATGGMSYPLTGSTGDGYKMAKALGHTVEDIKPSLVPLVCHEGFCSALSGLTLKNVNVKFFKGEDKRPVYEELGELLFTHFGVSGPIPLSASAHLRDIENENYYMVIDLKPGLTTEKLDKRIVKDFITEQNKDFQNSLNKLLPKSLIPIIVKLSGIKKDTKVNAVTKEQRQNLVSLIKNFKLHIIGTRPIEEAIITSGGISVKEISPKTMESKLIGGLYFAGEIIDVDAYTGGFNLQIAFSTGYLAGKSAVNGE